VEGAARAELRRGTGEGWRRAGGVEADAGALKVGAAWRWPGRSRSARRGGRCRGHGGAEAGPVSTAGASRAAGVEGSGVETARRWTTKH